MAFVSEGLGRALVVAVEMAAALVVLYLLYINHLMSGTPEEVRKLSPKRWTEAQLLETYRRLEKEPIDYAHQLPPKLERRYIVVGGSGLVGGFIVLQLLMRGQPASCIRIVDFRAPDRSDMLTGAAAEVDFARADISSAAAAEAAFSRPWPSAAVAALPLTVFHTAAVIVPSDRSPLLYGFCRAVNVDGTKHVLDSARRAGCDVFVFTSSGSISIRPVHYWVRPAPGTWPGRCWQVLDEADFWSDVRPHDEFYGNYPASKAAAERAVCDANEEGFRTGCLRPANGVYGNPNDNTVAGPIHMQRNVTWTVHIVQSFVHAINVGIAHLQYERILLPASSHTLPQAGRPFTITDPNPPIAYGDLYLCLSTLLSTPFSIVPVPPVLLLLASHPVELYNLLHARFPGLRRFLPPIKHDIRHLQPGLFSICTHLVADDSEARKAVEQGGLGYTGVLTTLEGMVAEALEWNRENVDEKGRQKRRHTSSVSLGEEIRRLGESAGKAV